MNKFYKKNFVYQAQRFEEWQSGRCISSGQIKTKIKTSVINDNVFVELQNCNLKIISKFGFVLSQILHDRIQYVNSTLNENINQDVPIVYQIFVKNGEIDYIRFAMANPDRLIEFYGTVVEMNSNLYNNTIRQNKSEVISKIKLLTALSASDGNISKEEFAIIMLIAIREGLTTDEVLNISKEPNNIILPSTHKEKIETLQDLVLVMLADGHIDKSEEIFCKKIALKLGFVPQIIDQMIVDKLNEMK